MTGIWVWRFLEYKNRLLCRLEDGRLEYLLLSYKAEKSHEEQTRSPMGKTCSNNSESLVSDFRI